MPKDTTREGVSPSGDPGTQDPPVETTPITDATNPRRSALAEIVANRRSDLEGEINEDRPEDQHIKIGPDPEGPEAAEPPTGDEAPTDPGEPAPEPAPDANRQAEPEAGNQDAPAPAPSEPMMTVKLEGGEEVQVPVSSVSTTIKLDGVAQQRSGQDLVTGYQTAAVSHARLREATQRLTQAKQLEANAGQTPTAQPDTAPADPPDLAPSDSDDDAIRKKAKEIAKAVQFGDEDEAAEQLIPLLKGRGNETTTPDVDAITREAVTRAVAVTAENEAVNSDLKAVGGVYVGIFKDTELSARAGRRVNEIRAQHLTELGHSVEGLAPAQVQQLYNTEQAKGTVPTRRAVFFQAAEDTRNWVKSLGGDVEVIDPATPANPEPAPATTPAIGKTFQEKGAAKREIVTPPAPAQGVRQQPAPEKPKKTGSDIVADFRRARGQAVA